MADSSGLPPPYLDPSQYPAYLDVQRKQQLAQMLMGAMQQSNQTPENWNSMKVVPRRGALQNVSMLTDALLAGKAQKSALQSQQQYFQGMMGGQPHPQSTGPGAGIVSPDAPPAAQDAAQAVTSGNVQQPSAVSPPAPNPMIPRDMGRGTANALMSMLGPQEYAKTIVAPNYTPLEMTRQLEAAGIPPNSPMARDYIQRRLLKENYIAPTAARPGSGLVGPEGDLKFFMPSVPQGSMPQFGPDGKPTAITQIPGGEAAAAAESAGKTAGTVSQTPQEVGVDAQGRKVFVYPTPPALSGQKPAAAGGAGSTAAAAPGAGQTASPATVEAQRKGGESGQVYSSELSKNATGATEVRRSLSEMRNLAAQATPGAANESKMKLGSMMIAAGVSPETTGKWLGVDVGALQAAAKQNATLAVNSIHAMTSRGTNFDLDTFIRNNPNMNMADPAAFNRVVDYMDNKAKQEIAKQKDFVQWKKGVSPDEWEAGHTAHWLEQQNTAIDQGQSNSPRPAPSFEELQAEARRRGLIK